MRKRTSLIAGLAAVLAATMITGAPQSGAGQESAAEQGGRGHYASVNGLNMYYEVHGKHHDGPPLVLIHGAFSATGTSFGELIRPLAKTRKVISVEQQAHGRTADIDRPLRVEQMAEDTAALLRQIGVGKADFFGYSMGAGIALQIGLKHPDLTRKLVFGSLAYHVGGLHPGLLEGLDKLRPEDLHGSPFHEEYLRIAPRPQDFPVLVEKYKDMNRNLPNVPAEAIKSLKAPALVLIGDSDIIRPEHAVETFRLLGGGVPGDNVSLPNSQLAVLPGTTHVTLVHRADLLIPSIPKFLA